MLCCSGVPHSEYLPDGKRVGTQFSLCMTKTEMEDKIRELFPRLGAFKLCKRGQDNILVDLLVDIIPAKFREHLKFSSLYVIPFELKPYQLPAQSTQSTAAPMGHGRHTISESFDSDSDGSACSILNRPSVIASMHLGSHSIDFTTSASPQIEYANAGSHSLAPAAGDGNLVVSAISASDHGHSHSLTSATHGEANSLECATNDKHSLQPATGDGNSSVDSSTTDHGDSHSLTSDDRHSLQPATSEGNSLDPAISDSQSLNPSNSESMSLQPATSEAHSAEARQSEPELLFVSGGTPTVMCMPEKF